MAQTLPLILLAGNAGSGKDTFGSFLAKAAGGTTIAQSDAMKRFVLANFNVNPEHLWGPSELRSKMVSTVLLDGTGTWNTKGEAGELLNKLGIDRVEQWYQEHIWREKQVTVRHLLQTFGTELGRNYKRDLWVDTATKNSMMVLDEGYQYDARTGISSTKGHWATANVVIITDGRFRNEVLNVKKMNGAVVKIINTKKMKEDIAKGIKDPHPSEMELASIPNTWYNHVVINRMEGLEELNQQAYGLLSLLQL